MRDMCFQNSLKVLPCLVLFVLQAGRKETHVTDVNLHLLHLDVNTIVEIVVKYSVVSVPHPVQFYLNMGSKKKFVFVTCVLRHLTSHKQLKSASTRKRTERTPIGATRNEDLELALALSASEAESNQQNNQVKPTSNVNKPPVSSSSSISGVAHLLPVLDTSEMDPELAQYLSKHYQRAQNSTHDMNASSVTYHEHSQDFSGHLQSTTQPSAPIYASSTPSDHGTVSMTNLKSGMNNDLNAPVKGVPVGTNSVNENITMNLSVPEVPELTNPKQEEFLEALRGSIEFFVNRLQSNSQRGRNISSDTTVQALFLTLNDMHPQLLNYKHYMEERRAYFEKLQDKLNQIREAREALDALRHDYAVRKQLEEQEAARMRQLQIMQKLEAMRQQKRDSLEYKLRIALKQNMQYHKNSEYRNNNNNLCHILLNHSYHPNYSLPYMSGPSYPSFQPVQNGYLPRDNRLYTTQFPDPGSVVSNQTGPGVSVSTGYAAPQFYPSYTSIQLQGTQNPVPTGSFSMQNMQAALPMYAGQEDVVREDLKGYPTNQTYPSSQFLTDTKTAPNYAPAVTLSNEAPANFVEPATTEAQLISFD
ncbi:unnamed protein product [Heterobilharzia americana]|nr:unnamed protein product [Heterobilharzia americana]